MTKSDDDRRVIIAVTESTPLNRLWQVALRAVSASDGNVVAVYLHDERWRRAASLPFTREISPSGSIADFTPERADQVLSETAGALQRRVETLASDAGVTIDFRVLPDSDEAKLQTVFAGRCLVIAPSVLERHPLFAVLTRLDIHFELVEDDAA